MSVLFWNCDSVSQSVSDQVASRDASASKKYIKQVVVSCSSQVPSGPLSNMFLYTEHQQDYT